MAGAGRPQSADERSVVYALEEVRQSFNRADAARDALDAKAATLLGFVSAALAILLESAAQVVQPFTGPALDAVIVGIAASEVAMLAALWFLAAVLWPRAYRGLRGTDLANPELWRKPAADLRSSAIMTWKPLIEEADQVVAAKGEHFARAVKCLLVGATILVIVGLAFLLRKGVAG